MNLQHFGGTPCLSVPVRAEVYAYHFTGSTIDKVRDETTGQVYRLIE